MDTKILFYKLYKGEVQPVDYVNWATQMLREGISTHSLNILASLKEPLNIFEVEDYFKRASKELNLKESTKEESAQFYITYLLKTIIENKNNSICVAYEIYEIVREHVSSEEPSIWFEISEMIDDYRYGDNKAMITEDILINKIGEIAKKQLQSNSLFN